MKLQVNVNDELVKEIDEYAKAFGMSRSALCCYFIGQGIFGIKEGVKLSDKYLAQELVKKDD